MTTLGIFITGIIPLLISGLSTLIIVKCLDDSSWHIILGSSIASYASAQFIIFLIVLAMTNPTTEESNLTYHSEFQRIASVTNKSQIHASFTLGCGTINQIEYFVFYKKYSNNTYQLGKIPNRGNVLIVEDCSIPCIEWRRYVPKEIKGALRFIIKNPRLGIVSTVKYDQVLIHVPKGTVINSFNLNVMDL